MPVITPNAAQLIINHEVGGGQAYYNRRLLHPEWPRGASGVTIGVGYDLGYCTQSQFDADWGTRLARADLARLRGCIGAKGQAAAALLPGVRSITVPWAAAQAVFFLRSVPRYYRLALGAFPGMDRLHGDAQGALVSLVFNRGARMTDSRSRPGDRREMRAIRDLVPRGDLRGIAEQIRSMKRLVNRSLHPGLLRRRDDEAALVEGAIGRSPTETINQGVGAVARMVTGR
jgi:hypothetical protein